MATPGTVPALKGHRAEDIRELAVDAKEHEAEEELRLGYVAWTRARHLLSVSAWRWSPKLKSGSGPSPYLLRTREAIEQWGGEPLAWLDPVPRRATRTRTPKRSIDLPWPISHHTAEVDRRVEAARWVTEATPTGHVEEELDDMLLLERVQQWDDEMARLLEEARSDRSRDIAVPFPSSLSATALARLRDDPDAFARDLARPMPRPPSPAARFGTRFHAWVEARLGQQPLLDPDELPGRADPDIDDETDLKELIAAFESGGFADRRPFAVEAPFALVLDGQVVRGRIDAVYEEEVDGQPGYLVVDWKTNRQQTADPLQLAIYRLAWAELVGVPLERVRAAFYYVRTGEVVEPEDLAGRAELESLVSPR